MTLAEYGNRHGPLQSDRSGHESDARGLRARLALGRDRLHRRLDRRGVAEVVVPDRAQRPRPARRPAARRSGCSARRCPRREMSSRYLTRARRLLPCAATSTRLPARMAGAIVLVPVGQEAGDRVLEALGQRQLGRASGPRSAGRGRGSARRSARAAAAGRRSCAARSSPAPRRTSPPSPPCSAPAARRSGAR